MVGLPGYRLCYVSRKRKPHLTRDYTDGLPYGAAACDQYLLWRDDAPDSAWPDVCRDCLRTPGVLEAIVVALGDPDRELVDREAEARRRSEVAFQEAREELLGRRKR